MHISPAKRRKSALICAFSAAAEESIRLLRADAPRALWEASVEKTQEETVRLMSAFSDCIPEGACSKAEILDAIAARALGEKIGGADRLRDIVEWRAHVAAQYKEPEGTADEIFNDVRMLVKANPFPLKKP